MTLGVTENTLWQRPLTPLKDMFSRIQHLQPSTEFRRTWQYNNIAYHIAAAIPEVLYGIPFGQYARETFLHKLGMNATYFDADISESTMTGGRAQGFGRRNQDLDACARDEDKQGFSAACLGDKVNIGLFDPRQERTPGHWGIASNLGDLVSHIDWLVILLAELNILCVPIVYVASSTVIARKVSIHQRHNHSRIRSRYDGDIP